LAGMTLRHDFGKKKQKLFLSPPMLHISPFLQLLFYQFIKMQKNINLPAAVRLW
jgi:hypothetical protein